MFMRKFEGAMPLQEQSLPLPYEGRGIKVEDPRFFELFEG